MRIAVTIAAAVALAGCDVPATPAEAACRAAITYGDKFGTPERKGPCWGRTVSVSQMGSIRAYLVEMPLPGHAFGSITYDGDRMVQAGWTAGP